jgi:hypothetical protein
VVDLLEGHALNRALAALTLGWSEARKVAPGPWSVPFLIRALDDSYPAVRLFAWQGLRQFPEFAGADFDYVALPAVRRGQLETIRNRWRGLDGSGVPMPHGAFPVGADGRPSSDVVDRLLAGQDKTQLFVSE